MPHIPVHQGAQAYHRTPNKGCYAQCAH
jgi:hypothetical protein